jgi:hypothetical protein
MQTCFRDCTDKRKSEQKLAIEGGKRMYKSYEFARRTYFAINENGVCGTGKSHEHAIADMEGTAAYIDNLKAENARLQKKLEWALGEIEKLKVGEWRSNNTSTPLIIGEG